MKSYIYLYLFVLFKFIFWVCNAVWHKTDPFQEHKYMFMFVPELLLYTHTHNMFKSIFHARTMPFTQTKHDT